MLAGKWGKKSVTLKWGSGRLQIIPKKMEHFNVLKNHKINNLTLHYTMKMPLHGINISDEEKKPICSVVPKFIIVLT